jgi:zinc/manganese transport system substrate-binding protein
MSSRRRALRLFIASITIVAAAVLAGCGAAGTSAAHGKILAVGAENEYGDVIAQVGGRYVDVSSIMSNPNTDPHTFEASPSVAQTISGARLVVQNGVGYDDFMAKLESASSNASRKVVDVQTLLGLPDSTPNPHLWYSPKTMPAVARAVAADLAELMPAHAAYFRAGARRFVASLRPLDRAIARFRTQFPHATAATTEPVADYLLQAAGIDNLTPFPLQADIMNGTDPAPQAISLQQGLFSAHRARVFVYNQQVTDSVTKTFLADAQRAHVPVVGVYETMPSGYHYQSWMLAELSALRRALADGVSTTHLGRS